MTDRSWFSVRALASDDAEIAIYDEIGLFGISAKDFHNELKALGPVSHITLRINSPGGYVTDGFAIYNMLKRHRAHITVTVDGVAASMASVVAMAGDVVLMPSNAWMMIHDPSGVIVGTSKEMRDLAGFIDRQKETLVAAYAVKSGMDHDEIAQMMSDETWLSAEDAVSLGFADAIEGAVKVAASFDLSKFKNAPALAAGKSQEEPTMAKTDPVIFDTLTLDQLKAERPDLAEAHQAEVKAQIDADAEAARIAAEEAAAADAAKREGQETPEQIEARIRADDAEITALCEMAGMSAKASEFIKAKKSKGEVAVALLRERATTSVNTTVSPRKPNNEKTPAVIDTVAVWDKWNGRPVRA